MTSHPNLSIRRFAEEPLFLIAVSGPKTSWVNDSMSAMGQQPSFYLETPGRLESARSGDSKRKGVPSTPLFGLAWRRNLIVAAFILIDAEAIFFAERGIVVLADCTDLDLDRSIVRE